MPKILYHFGKSHKFKNIISGFKVNRKFFYKFNKLNKVSLRNSHNDHYNKNLIKKISELKILHDFRKTKLVILRGFILFFTLMQLFDFIFFYYIYLFQRTF